LQLLPSLYIGVLFQLLEIAGFEVFVELPLNSLFAFCDLCCLMIVVAVADAEVGTFEYVSPRASGMGVRWLDAVGDDDLATAGGKGASLGELVGAGLPVPPGFVVTADSYRRFIEASGIAESLFDAVAVDPEDAAALADAERRARELVMETPLPEDLVAGIEAAYDDLDGDPFVAVRSSATAEDLPEASFAGTQETYLNVTREELIDRVKRCWASLFTRRAIYYRHEQGFDDRDVDVAVVVQRMVDADASGVLFTSHPSTGAPQTIVEAAWGLGEGVVSGTVSPDNYVVDRDSGDLLDVTVADKHVEVVRGDDGETVEREVSSDRREARVLDDGTLGQFEQPVSCAVCAAARA